MQIELTWERCVRPWVQAFISGAAFAGIGVSVDSAAAAPAAAAALAPVAFKSTTVTAVRKEAAATAVRSAPGGVAAAEQRAPLHDPTKVKPCELEPVLTR